MAFGLFYSICKSLGPAVAKIDSLCERKREDSA